MQRLWRVRAVPLQDSLGAQGRTCWEHKLIHCILYHIVQSYSLTVACHIFGGLTSLISLIFEFPISFRKHQNSFDLVPLGCKKCLELVSFGLSQSCMILPQLLISAASGSTTAWSFPYHEMTQAMPGGPTLLGCKSGVFRWSGEETGASTEWVLSCVSYSDIFSITLGLYMLTHMRCQSLRKEAPTESTQLLKSRTTEGTATGSGCRCFLWHCVLCIQVGRRLGRSTG